MARPQVNGEVLFEFRQLGGVTKVSALHVDSNTEVCLVGPRSAGRTVLQDAVLRKLAFVLGRQARESAASVVPPPPRRRGVEA